MGGGESQTRLLQSRIDSLEKHLLEIHNSIASYATKIAKTRDSADLVATNIKKLEDNVINEISLYGEFTRKAKK
ncbi:unnamed protein product [Oppiella nova]|uniref:Uncharacterized protein n=1 Tax=Oppiella nova TaxID=334625 RepID=A0A7R9LQL4_9ACAR|nr:unnamed protein product [Oppiella nova]CAG2166008.1 unnamed protein product [Oppiella nova]